MIEWSRGNWIAKSYPDYERKDGLFITRVWGDKEDGFWLTGETDIALPCDSIQPVMKLDIDALLAQRDREAALQARVAELEKELSKSRLDYLTTMGELLQPAPLSAEKRIFRREFVKRLANFVDRMSKSILDDVSVLATGRPGDRTVDMALQLMDSIVLFSQCVTLNLTVGADDDDTLLFSFYAHGKEVDLWISNADTYQIYYSLVNKPNSLVYDHQITPAQLPKMLEWLYSSDDSGDKPLDAFLNAQE